MTLLMGTRAYPCGLFLGLFGVRSSASARCVLATDLVTGWIVSRIPNSTWTVADDFG